MAVVSTVLRSWLFAMLAASLLLPSDSALAQLVYRWVDDDGKVHYNTTLPPEYANRPHQVLQNGIVIKSVDDPTAPELTPEQQKLEEETVNSEEADRERQLRADRLLVLKYRSEGEILDAMQVEIDNLAYDARIIEQSRTSVMSSLTGQIREAADRQRSGLPVDQKINEEIGKLRARLSQGVASRASLDRREAQIRELFNAELRRYRFLIEGGEAGAVDPSEPVVESGP